MNGSAQRPIKVFLTEAGGFSLFVSRFFQNAFHPRFEWREFIRQSVQNGNGSLPLVAVTAFIMGLVLTVQSRPTLARFGAESMLPAMVAISMVREIVPVITALICAGKIASGMSAELGSMKVTEQIDALTTLSTNPLKYLAVPRVLAATLAVPVLVAVGDSIGIMGGWLVGVQRLDFNSAAYIKNTVDFLELWDVTSGLLKGAAFGFLVALMGCYHGMNSARGAQGVGAATKAAVVSASVLILAANYVLTEVFFSS